MLEIDVLRNASGLSLMAVDADKLSQFEPEFTPTTRFAFRTRSSLGSPWGRERLGGWNFNQVPAKSR
jgi:hypothetical protein